MATAAPLLPDQTTSLPGPSQEHLVAPRIPPGSMPAILEQQPKDPDLKLCRHCGDKKPRTDYHKNHSKADTLEDVCKQCKAQRDAARRKARANFGPQVASKVCKKCQVEKPAEEFPRNKLTSDGLHSYCKKCKLLLDTLSREKRKQEAGHTPRNTRPALSPPQQQLDQQQQQMQQQMQQPQHPETQPHPEQLYFCDSCKTHQLYTSFAEDPTLPGVLRCAACRAGNMAAAYEAAQQGLENAVQAGQGDVYAPLAPPMTGPHPTNGLHGVLADSYPMPGPEPGAFEGMPMPQELPVMSMTMTMPMPMPSAPAEPQNALEADNTLTALLVDPTLNQPIQVVARKQCHGCRTEKDAVHFMPDRRSEDHLMNYCRECCEGGSAAPQLPRRPGRPPRAAALYPLTQKTCRKCHETKATEEFPHKKAHPDGRDDYCKACHAAATAARVAARGPVKEPTVNSKECSKCHQQKSAAEFHRDCNKADGLRGRCRNCESVAGQARRQSRTKTLEPTVEAKICRRCNQEKRADDFPRKKERSDGLDSYCKACNCAMTSERMSRKAATSIPVVTKLCGRCNQEKPATEFVSRRGPTSGMDSTYCNACKVDVFQNAASVQEGSANGLQAPNGTVADVASIAAGSYAAPEPLQHEVAAWQTGLEVTQDMGLQKQQEQAAWMLPLAAMPTDLSHISSAQHQAAQQALLQQLQQPPGQMQPLQ